MVRSGPSSVPTPRCAPGRRFTGFAVVLGLVLLTVAGCGGTVPHPSEATPTASASPNGATAPAPPRASRAPSASPTSAPAGFPGAPRSYAEATLAAWSGRQVSRLSDLTTPAVRQQVLELPGLQNQDWTYQLCGRAAGSSYCSFVNADGDVITLRVVDDRLGKSNAITEARLDRTTYPADAVEYVKGFVEAWRNANRPRLLALSNPAEAEYVSRLTPPDQYSVCAVTAGQIAQVRTFNSAGVDLLFRVSLPALGAKHAITAHTIASPLCPA